MTAGIADTKPFSLFEWMLAGHYLLAQDGVTDDE
jgi:hypothetical protein